MSRARGLWPWLITAAAIVWLLCAVAWPRDTITLTGLALSLLVSGWALVTGVRMLRREHRTRARQMAVRDATAHLRHLGEDFAAGLLDQWASGEDPDEDELVGCAGCGGPDCTQRPDDLTAQEARALADDLGLQLYRAQDALAFVAEMCDIADEHRGRRGQPATVTTARVREWLKGAQCARQAGLVLGTDASGQDPETARTDPDTTGHDAPDQDGHHPDDIRTALDDPAEGSHR